MADVLAIFAHPDDETFICGGSLAQFAAKGQKVALVCATKGEMGRRVGVPPTATRETLPKLRETELRNACAALSIENLTFLGYRDKTLEIQPIDEMVDSLVHILNDEHPSVVITFHERLGGHQDHCTIGRAARLAFERYAKDCKDDPTLLYVAWAGMASDPKAYGLDPKDIVQVDIRDALAQKLKAFRAHKTQSDLNSWLWKKDARAMDRLSAHEYFIRAEGPRVL